MFNKFYYVKYKTESGAVNSFLVFSSLFSNAGKAWDEAVDYIEGFTTEETAWITEFKLVK